MICFSKAIGQFIDFLRNPDNQQHQLHNQNKCLRAHSKSAPSTQPGPAWPLGPQSPKTLEIEIAVAQLPPLSIILSKWPVGILPASSNSSLHLQIHTLGWVCLYSSAGKGSNPPIGGTARSRAHHRHKWTTHHLFKYCWYRSASNDQFSKKKKYSQGKKY